MGLDPTKIEMIEFSGRVSVRKQDSDHKPPSWKDLALRHSGHHFRPKGFPFIHLEDITDSRMCCYV